MKKDPCVYLLHIRDAIECITTYTSGGKKVFLSDEKTQDAVILNLAIIGEAVKKLSPRVKSHYPEIPWKNIAGTRDVLIHDYDSTEIIKIWNIVKKDIPILRRTIKKMLKDLATNS
ncbi:DUF86 domain-containing protein [Candidatus Peribacteria bacterium]|nr:DUF86 domain-containing protein [Candidatus Peribacteria bacterium]